MALIEKADKVLRRFEDYKQIELPDARVNRVSFKDARRFAPPWGAIQLVPAFKYDGGKRDAAAIIWKRLGWDIPNYIEPFCGGLSVLLARPLYDMREQEPKRRRELANDTNLFLINFWRTVQQQNIEELIKRMNFPANEVELLARRKRMMARRFELAKNIHNVDYYDSEIAAYWLYIQRQWIGAGGDNPHMNPELKMVEALEPDFMGTSIGDHLRFIQARTRYIRFFSGDWKRPLRSATQTINIGTTGVFLDPPYLNTSKIYKGRLDEGDPENQVPLEARDWALEFGRYPAFRIAYCGYSHHHKGVFPEGKNGWAKKQWKIKNGRSLPGDDKLVEIDTIWFSPHCSIFLAFTRGASTSAFLPSWAPLVSQAGLTLGLSAVVERAFGAFGVEVSHRLSPVAWIWPCGPFWIFVFHPRRRPADRRGVDLTEAMAIRRAPARQVVADPAHEHQQQPQRTERAPPGYKDWEERERDRDFGQRQQRAQRRRQPIRHAEASERLPRAGAVGQLS